MARTLDRRCAGLTTLLAFLAAGVVYTQMQTPTVVARAKHVVELLREEKFEEVAKGFNAQMAAALSASQLRETWWTFRQQVGPFASFLDERVATPAPGTTSVVLGCQFEKAAARLIVAFDADGKISGLRFAPQAGATSAPTPPPSSARFTEESVTIGAGEWSLPGTLTIPRERTSVAGVVLVHGSGPSDQDATLGPNKPFRDIAWGLAARGIAVLRYEKRTHRYAGKLRAQQSFTVHDVIIDDALKAAALLRTRREIDPARIFVLGHSLGATLAPWIAADDGKLAGLIIMAGSTRPLFETIREQLSYVASLSPGALHPEQALQKLRRAAPESYWRELDAYKPAQVAATLRIPMIILQGERDYQVTSADLQGWREALAHRRDVTIKSYPPLNHLFMAGEGKATPAEYSRPGTVAALVLDDMANWIGQTSADRR